LEEALNEERYERKNKNERIRKQEEGRGERGRGETSAILVSTR